MLGIMLGRTQAMSLRGLSFSCSTVKEKCVVIFTPFYISVVVEFNILCCDMALCYNYNIAVIFH